MIWLLISGLAQGAESWLQQQLGPADCCHLSAGDPAFKKRLAELPGPVVIHDLAAWATQQHEDAIETFVRDIGTLAAQKHIIIHYPEVGSGLVPANQQQRLEREIIGRLGCRLASVSDYVVRLICGLEQILKDDRRSG